MDTIAIYRSRAAEQPDDPGAQYGLGVLVLDAHRRGAAGPDGVADAVAALRRAAALAPRRAACHAALGYALALDGDTAAALEAFQRAHALAPDNGTYEVYVVSLLAETGQPDAALEKARAVAARHAVDLAAARDALREAGRPVDAAGLIRQGFLDPRTFFESWLRDEAQWLAAAAGPSDSKEA